MLRVHHLLPLLLAALAPALLAPMPGWAQKGGPVITDPAQGGVDYQLQGEYSGEVRGGDGSRKLGVQVIALGEGKFHAVAYFGGLPGDGWNGERKVEADGQLDNGQVEFRGDNGGAILTNQGISLRDADGNEVGQLQRVERQSPTLGAKPPAGSQVLFDGSGVEQWAGGKMTDDGLLMPGTTSKARFGDHTVHIEFRLPFQPQARGQARGNSGIYLQGRYEVQMLDSFGLEGKDNECGGIYSVKAPDVNMCLPPLAWQTYDIDYTAARHDDTGNLKSNPRITVRHNGEVIHNNIELPGERVTTAAPVKAGPEAGPLYLQDHGNPVRYRNIWVVPKK